MAAGLLALLCVGCIPTLPLRHLSIDAPPTSAPVVRASASAPALAPVKRASLAFLPDSDVPATMSLNELVDIAVKRHPDLSAAYARVESAKGQMIQAGLYPNPVIGPRFSQLGDRVNPTGEAGAMFTQSFVTAHKLKIARAAAERGVEAADWQALTQWYAVVSRVRFAYYELLTSLREFDTLADIVRVSEQALQAAVTLEKAGAGNRPDVLRARVELEQNRLKKEVSVRRVDAARQNLYTALGRPSDMPERVELDRKELEQIPAEPDWKAMLTCLRENSSELQEARALIVQQERLVAKAQADVVPNIDVSLTPFYASRDRELRALVLVTAPVPIFNRNQGNIHSAKAELARAAAGEQQRELLLIERLTIAQQRYLAARRQNDAYRESILKDARESFKLVGAGYRRGDPKYDYTTVLQAQQVLFQAELAHTQALGDLWRSVVEIAWILQQDDVHAGCAVRHR